MGVPPGPQLVPAAPPLRWPRRCRSVTLARPPPPVCCKSLPNCKTPERLSQLHPCPGDQAPPPGWDPGPRHPHPTAPASSPPAPVCANHSSLLWAASLLFPPRPSCSLRRWCLASRRPLLPGPASPPWKALPASVATCSAFPSLSVLSSPSECLSCPFLSFPGDLSVSLSLGLRASLRLPLSLVL